MKYLKLYENTRSFWLVSYTANGQDGNYELHPSKKSAENSVIIYVNENLIIEPSDGDYNENDLVTNINDAIKYYDDYNNYATEVNIIEIELFDEVELSDEIKILRQTKKYNI